MTRLLATLPPVLDQPYVYLSVRQRARCLALPLLATMANQLPGWCPQRLVADALGRGLGGIDLALRESSGIAWVWATELENVHATWSFPEPELDIDGILYLSSETYYHSQKPNPFDEALWEARKVEVMRRAIRAKIAASAEARSVLLATHPHPLLSIKRDNIWGFDPVRGGQNLLAVLMMELRAELVAAQPRARPDSCVTASVPASAPTPSNSQAQALANARDLFTLYCPEFRPPQWVLDGLMSPCSGDGAFTALARRVVCYHPIDANPDTVRRILHERQPVNIAMNLGFDAAGMEARFGFGGAEGSGYTRVAVASGQLPPNIAVYCPTPVGGPAGPVVHVVNSIAFAFDSARQPDYQHFFVCADGSLNPAKRAELVARLTTVYRLVFTCARDLGLSRVCISFVGGGAFCGLYPGGARAYFNEAYLPALEAALDEALAVQQQQQQQQAGPGVGPSRLTTIGLIGAQYMDAALEQRLELAVKTRGLAYKKEGRVPDCLLLHQGPEASQTLWQNAWDCHSIAGNGNAGDNSLDGYFGRSTAISVLTFPSTNPAGISLRAVP